MSPVSSTSKTADKNSQQEIWKPVKDYEASYEISSWGRIRSLHFAKPRLIKLHPAEGGSIVFLSKNGKKQTFSVSELLKQAFPEGVNQASSPADKEAQTAAQGASASGEGKGTGTEEKPSEDPQSGEQWKDIPGYAGSYQVSQLGNVRSLSMTPGFILRQTASAEGRPQVSLYSFRNKGGRRLGKSTVTNFDVDELVARAFVAQVPQEGEVVLHKNGDLKDNRADNLCWGRAEDAQKLAEETAAAARIAQARQALKDKAQRLAEAARAAAQSKQEAESAGKAQKVEEVQKPREQDPVQSPAVQSSAQSKQEAESVGEEDPGRTSFARVQAEADRILAQVLKKPQPAAQVASAPQSGKDAPAQKTQTSAPAGQADGVQAKTVQAADSEEQARPEQADTSKGDLPQKPAQAQALQDKPVQASAASESTQGTTVRAASLRPSSQGVLSPAARPATVEEMRRKVKPRMQSLSDRSVCCSTLKGGMLCMFPTASAAARALGCVDTLDVMIACEGMIEQLCGYQWQWVKATAYHRWSALAAPITMLPSQDWSAKELS